MISNVAPLSHNRITSRSQLQVLLASPWHFRKQGVYQLRVRPRGSLGSCTVSLRTTDRSAAMNSSKLLQSTLRAFHLDNPESTWEELRAHLKAIADDLLATPTEWDRLDDQAELYADWQSDLHAITRTASLTLPQTKAAILGGRILGAAQERLHGRAQAFVDVIEEINQDYISDSDSRSSLPLSVGATQSLPPVTFEALSATYREEHKANVTPSSLQEIGYCHKVITEALGSLDLRTHTRADMVALRDTLLESRKASTVNNLITKAGSVLKWAVANDLIPKAYIQNLKIKKGADSTRKAFTQEQVGTIMGHANGLLATSWVRWALSLAVLTGARLNEIVQLTKDDIKQVGDVWVIDINDNDGKELKTAQSKRQVPLTDGAYGFDLGEFLRFVDGAGKTVLGVTYWYAGRTLNGALRDIVGSDDSDLTLHSLRHSMASLLQAEGVPVAYVQAILGRSSGTLAFDTYGSGVPVEKLAMTLTDKLPIR